MKNSVIISVFMLASIFAISALAQDAKPEDKTKRPSPPAMAEGKIKGVTVKVDYSAPSAKGRKMLGGIEPFGTVWRTGANESTIIEFSGPVKIGGKNVAAGKYALFTIPGEKEWVIIINTGIKWGAYDYKESEDIARVTVPAEKAPAFVETFKIEVVKNKVVLKWENTQVGFKVAKG
jgi:Protein of unknown function (DUF2911)